MSTKWSTSRIANRLRCRDCLDEWKESSAAAQPERISPRRCVWRSELDENAIVVFIVCDTGEHYLTKHHSDEWLKEKRLLEPQKITAGLISGTKKPQAPKSLVSVAPADTVGGRARKRWTSWA